MAALVAFSTCVWPYGRALAVEDDDAQDNAAVTLVSGSTEMKAQYSAIYDADKDLPASSANGWQVVRENHDDVKSSGAYSYSADDAVRVQKTVRAVGTENDFQVYLNVEPQLSWEEFFKSLDNYATHNNASTFNPNSGCSRLLSQEEYDELPQSQKNNYAKINVTYQLSNKSYTVVRYGNFFGSGKDQIQNVKNGSYAWSSEKFNTNGLINSIDWRALTSAAQSGTDLSLVINARELEKQFTFSDHPVYPKSVADPIGEDIRFGSVISADLGSVDAPEEGSLGGTLTWTLPTADYPDPPYYSDHTEPGKIPGTNVDGSVTVVDNLVTVERNGKKTAYYTGVLEMRYSASLDVAADGFVSCADPTSAPSAEATYDTNGQTTLSYLKDGAQKTTDFPIPAVRGLLYDLELKKVDEKTGAGLEGAVFELLDASGDPVLDASGDPMTATSASDGSVKFHNLAPGTYSAREARAPQGYLMAGASVVGPYELCWTTNKSLVVDHADRHAADWVTDVRNMLPAGAIPELANRRTAGLLVLKQDAASAKPLQNVGFALRVDDGDGVYTDADTPAKAWLDAAMTQAGSEGVTDASGMIGFYGLEPGTYWLVETRALAGYRLLDTPIKVTVTNDSKVFFHDAMVEGSPDETNVVRITVNNEKIPVLPATGSSDGLALLLVGCSSILVAALAGVPLLGGRGRRRH